MTLCHQFHQHFTSTFFVQKRIEQLFFFLEFGFERKQIEQLFSNYDRLCDFWRKDIVRKTRA